MLVGLDGLSVVVPNGLRFGYSRGYDLVLQRNTLEAVLLEDIHVDDFRNGYKSQMN